jgi:transposase
MEKPEKKKVKLTSKVKAVTMELLNPYSAGIDISDKEHVVAVAEGLSEERVRTFGSMTCDLLMLSDWLLSCKVTTVAMESTGVYWQPLFSHLVSKGIEVYLVNAAHVKNVSGRKDDENDAMWLQKLHSCGLLRSSYLPDTEQEQLRTIVRYRRTLLEDSSRFINRIQKSLELMNIKFHTVIRDITGVSGMAVLQAILSGERNPENFLPLLDYRIKADRATIIKSLEGQWQSEHLFTLKQSYELYLEYRKKIQECEAEIERHLQRLEAKINEGEIADKMVELPAKERKMKYKNSPQIANVRQYLEKIHGVDVLAIYGLSDGGGLDLLAELGTDLSKWADENKFIGWLNLCPNQKISAGKVLSSRVKRQRANAASKAFKFAANSVQRSDHWLGDYFRRMKTKGGNKYAIIATANKIARIYYKMVTQKVPFIPMELSTYQQQRQQKQINYLERKLERLKAASVA